LCSTSRVAAAPLVCTTVSAASAMAAYLPGLLRFRPHCSHARRIDQHIHNQKVSVAIYDNGNDAEHGASPLLSSQGKTAPHRPAVPPALITVCRARARARHAHVHHCQHRRAGDLLRRAAPRGQRLPGRQLVLHQRRAAAQARHERVGDLRGPRVRHVQHAGRHALAVPRHALQDALRAPGAGEPPSGTGADAAGHTLPCYDNRWKHYPSGARLLTATCTLS